MSISNAQEINLLKSLKNEAPTKYEKVWVKLHTGDPGEEGTENAFGDTTRKSTKLTGENPLKSESVMKWESLSAGGTLKWVSCWSAEAAGTCLWIIQLTAEKAVSEGDTFEIAAEKLTLELN